MPFLWVVKHTDPDFISSTFTSSLVLKTEKHLYRLIDNYKTDSSIPWLWLAESWSRCDIL